MLRRHVDDGAYASCSAAIVDGLRLLDERDRRRDARLAVIRRELDKAANDPVRLTSDDLRRHFQTLAAEAEKKRLA